MSLAIGHFAVGVTGTVLLLLVTGLYRRIQHDGVVAILGGVWAMLPDADVLLPIFEDFDHNPAANVFWFHHYLDTHEATDTMGASAAFVVVMVATLLLLQVVEWNGKSATPD